MSISTSEEIEEEGCEDRETPRAGPKVVISGVTHSYPARTGSRETVSALADINLEVADGEFVALVGKSGCGKTTLLNLIAGLHTPTQGSISIDGTSVRSTRRSTGYMFARDALLPWRRALDNVAYGLELRGVKKNARHEIARGLLNTMGIADFGGSYRAQLSQGMRQRVALARTLATDPDLLLLDEPFAALDAQTKAMLQSEFLRVIESSGKTVVLVTHDLDEAVGLGDRVVVLSSRPGRVVLDVDIDIPRPRDVDGLIENSRYRELRRLVRDALNKIAN